MRRRLFLFPAVVVAVGVLALESAPAFAHNDGTTTTARSVGASGDPTLYTQSHQIMCNDESDCLDYGSLVTGKVGFTWSPTYTDYESCTDPGGCSYLWIYDPGLNQSCPEGESSELAYLDTRLSNSNQGHSPHGGLDTPGAVPFDCASDSELW